jgi:hypothetical protein
MSVWHSVRAPGSTAGIRREIAGAQAVIRVLDTLFEPEEMVQDNQDFGNPEAVDGLL